MSLDMHTDTDSDEDSCNDAIRLRLREVEPQYRMRLDVNRYGFCYHVTVWGHVRLHTRVFVQLGI